MQSDMAVTEEAPQFAIAGCSVADADGLAASNIPAFWTDPRWRLAWPDRSLEYHVIQVAKHYPYRLLSNRESNRHQKAVENGTGRVVGYARWILPTDYTTAWPDAVVPAVSVEDEAFYRRLQSSARMEPNEQTAPAETPAQKAKVEILSRKSYIGKFRSPSKR